MQVKAAEGKVRTEPGAVYFAPPDYHLLLNKGPQLAVSIDELIHFSRPSNDVLSSPLQTSMPTPAWGIGANEDGAAGLAAVHHGGAAGMTIVQEPGSAQLLSALQRTPEDPVLPLEQIAELLQTLASAEPLESGLCQKGK